MITYIGRRNPEASVARFVAAGRGTHEKPLAPRLDLVNHSPTGLEWSYGGSGPAQLALALLADVTGDDAWAVAHHQRFKWDVVVRLPWEWEMSQERVLQWVAKEKAWDQAEAHQVRTGEPPVP